jgi:two-component system sensor histidine kinase YesM
MRNNAVAVSARNGWKRLKEGDWPIRYRLISHFLMISIVPAICLGFLIDWAVDKIIDRQVNNYTLQLIGNVNKTLEFYAGNIQNISYFISFQPEVQRFLYEDALTADDYEVRKFLQGITTLYTEVAGIMLVNSEGDYISNEMYARTQRNLTEEDWYQQAVAQKGIFSLIGHPKGRNVITHVDYKEEEVVSVVRAILDPESQQVKGVVLIDLKLRVIAETVKDVRLGKTGFLMVVDHRGDAIYMPQTETAAHIDRSWFTAETSGILSKNIEGHDLQVIYRTSPFTNWTTVGVFPREEKAGEVREIRLYLVTFVFVLILLGIAASYYLSHTISLPIRQLMSMMRKAEDGNLSVRFRGGRHDEVGMLGRSFNAMLTQIDRLIDLVGLEQRKKREAELRSLQAQIKPHFLYNTLDTIHWLARKNGAHEVTEVVESLSRLFRIGLSRGNEMISLHDEFEHVKSYLIIQKTRYKEKLNYSISMDPTLAQCEVLKLILQPIVENAIYHGIKERRGPGQIDIVARRDERGIAVDVRDDGVGMSEETLERLREKLTLQTASNEASETGGGYGLLNVQERIRLNYGAQYGLELHSKKGQGTTVTVRHPILTMDGVGTDE